MLSRCFVAFWALILCCGSGLASPIFDYGTDWKYFIGISEASSPDVTAWRKGSFDDSTWQSGLAPIGYANPPNSPPEFNLVTILPASGSANYLSIFLRKKFTVKTPSAIQQLTLNINVDDGYVVWINGTEVNRYNVPAGDLAYNASASSAGEEVLVGTAITNNIASLLVSGDNVIAVQLFNGSLSSSDIFFDASLESDVDDTPPVVADSTPAQGEVVSELTSIEVLFSENVQGVDASDLLINGNPATSVNAANPRDYVFTFPQPTPGTVTISWASRHGITDTSAALNPFAGGGWTFTLDTSIPPPNVVISEFLADNNSGIKDDDGTRQDWIELYNYADDAVNLGGWFLTDTTNNLAKWRIPAFPLGSKAYLLIWASGKNRTNLAAQLHTNFKLGKDGGYLALVDPNTNIVSEFNPYPAQRSDISYGRDVIDPAITGFFATPTPGAKNSTTGSGFGPEPIFSKEEGIYTNASFSVSITAPSGQIRFTTDGSAPTTNSTIYSTPIAVSTTTTIKARVFQNGQFPSAVIAKSYILVDSTVANFSSKLPLIIASTSGKSVANHPAPGTPRTFVSIAALDTFRGVSTPFVAPDYLGQGGISIRGQTSSGFPKVPYRLELQDAFGTDRNSALFGLPAGSDWILNNPYTDKPFLQNFLAYELFEKMGHYSVRRKFVEVFLNTAGGKVTYPRDYMGVYILLEKIKVDNDRVPIARLTPYDTAEPNISGGYMFKKDKDTTGDMNFTTIGGAGFSAQTLKIHEPKPREISTAQYNWLVNYLRQFETALYATNWKTATGTNHYSYYMDVDSFVDQHWIVEYAKQIDGYRLSNYMQKDRNGKIKMEPIWDYNLSFGNADYLDGGNSSGWYWTQLDENAHIWLQRLMCGTTGSTGTTGDPDFLQRIADRWSELRTNVFNSTNVLARVDELAGLLNEAANRDFSKWPRLGTYVWPNSPMYVSPTTYAGIITAMKGFVQARYKWIDTQFIIPPAFGIPAGRVPSGLPVSISGTSSIYYTTDGSDPRLSGGGLSTKAVLYNGAVTINQNTRLFARTRSGSKWSGPTVATFITQPTTLIISEIMYHPAPPPDGSLYTAEDFEFIEFKNTGAAVLNLQGVAITDGVTFTFPAVTLNPGARTLVVKNRAAFESRYGAGLPIAGEFVGQLDNSGEHISVVSALQDTVLSFTFNNGWQPITDGPGFSLVLADEAAAPESLGNSSAWKASVLAGGSPGASEGASSTFPNVVVNEALIRTAVSIPSVELQNLSTTAADISGWFITDNFDKPKKYRFPTNTVIPAGGFLVVNANDFNGPNALQTFNLSTMGEEICLFSGDANTNLTGYVHGFKYGAQRNDETIGRVVSSDRAEHFVAQTSATLGSANAGPTIPGVVINEIMYRPPDVSTNGAFWNDTEDEYLELFNRTGASISLFDANHTTNTWKLDGDVNFTFAAGASIPAGGYLIVVGFDPVANAAQLSAFRQKFPLPTFVPIVGPFKGNLNNAGGVLKMLVPDAPLADGTVPYILAEQIDFQNPGAGDGLGFALSRKSADAFGNDPVNWTVATPSPGNPNATPSAPAIVQQPTSITALASNNVTLAVQAVGPGTLRYQWRSNGGNLINATNATLVLTNAQPNQSASYSVVVFNATGGTESKLANVTILADNDRDGMADSWELANGLNPFSASDATVDADSDGLTNLQEYLAGSDPRNASSRFVVSGVLSDTGVTIRFQAAANRSYTIQYTESLTAPTWIKLTDVGEQSASFTATVSDSASAAGRYYRIVTPRQP